MEERLFFNSPFIPHELTSIYIMTAIKASVAKSSNRAGAHGLATNCEPRTLWPPPNMRVAMRLLQSIPSHSHVIRKNALGGCGGVLQRLPAHPRTLKLVHKRVRFHQ
jgi:hypothetical protein